MMEDKRFKKMDPAILAQLDSGLTSRQYLNEGLRIMRDCQLIIDNVKSGNYNNYIGSHMYTDHTSPDRASGSSPNFSSMDRKRNRTKVQMIENEMNKSAE